MSFLILFSLASGAAISFSRWFCRRLLLILFLMFSCVLAFFGEFLRCILTRIIRSHLRLLVRSLCFRRSRVQVICPQPGSTPPDAACVGRLFQDWCQVFVAGNASLLQELQNCPVLGFQSAGNTSSSTICATVVSISATSEHHWLDAKLDVAVCAQDENGLSCPPLSPMADRSRCEAPTRLWRTKRFRSARTSTQRL